MPTIMISKFTHLVVTRPMSDLSTIYAKYPNIPNIQIFQISPNLVATRPIRSKARLFSLSSLPSIWGLHYSLNTPYTTVVMTILWKKQLDLLYKQMSHLSQEQGDSSTMLSISDSLAKECVSLPWPYMNFHGLSWTSVDFRGLTWTFMDFRGHP